MAHFAQLDENNVVVNVLVVADEDTADADGNEVEAIGVAFLEACFGKDNPAGTTYVQTSYRTSKGVHPDGTPLRLNFAGIGKVYDADRDAFYHPNPPKGWSIDAAGLHQPPTPPPEDGDYAWDEETEAWVTVTHPDGYEG